MNVYVLYRLMKSTVKITWKSLGILSIGLIYLLKFTYRGSYKVGNWAYHKMKYKESYYSKDQFWNLIRSINPRQFEVFCYELYKANGYKAKLTQATHDGGVDVILKKNKEITYVECKHYAKNNFIGREICQKLLGSCVMNGADKAIVFTTGGIHSNALECLDKVKHLDIVGYDDIYRMFNKLDDLKRKRIIRNTMSYS